MIFAFAIGAVGNVVGAAINGVDATGTSASWTCSCIVFANVLGLLVGFMLGVLIRNSAGAIVGYFVYSFVLPGIFGILAASRTGSRTCSRGSTSTSRRRRCSTADLTGEEWAQLGVSGLLWLVIPLAFGVWAVLRSEVK